MIKCGECPYYTPHDRHYGQCEAFLFETRCDDLKLGQCFNDNAEMPTHVEPMNHEHYQYLD